LDILGGNSTASSCAVPASACALPTSIGPVKESLTTSVKHGMPYLRPAIHCRRRLSPLINSAARGNHTPPPLSPRPNHIGPLLQENVASKYALRKLAD